MTLDDICREIKENVKDANPAVLAGLIDFVNDAYLTVTDEIDIPSLKTVYTVTTYTTQAYTTFPSNFSGKLRYVGTASDGEITVLDGGLDDLMRRFPDLTQTGQIQYVAIESGLLWYAKIPATETNLICLGYDTPNVLVYSTDVPSHIPSFLHRDILVTKATAIAFSKIEDGIDGPKPNTDLYESYYERGKAMLRSYIGRRHSAIGTSRWAH